MGGKGNIAREADLMGEVVDNLEDDKGTDLAEAEWTLRAKTI